MAPAPTPLAVVLPLQTDPARLLPAVAALVDAWPADVDARLVVPSTSLTARDRAVLAGLGDEVALVPSERPGFGHLVAAAAAAEVQPLLVLDPQALPGAAALAELAAGRPAPGGVLLDPGALLAAPVLTAALDLPSLQALLTAGSPVEQDAVGGAPEVREPSLDRAVPGRSGVVSVVVVVRDQLHRTRTCVEAQRRSTRRPHQLVVVDDGSTDGTGAWLAGQRDLVVVTNAAPRGPVVARNQGVAASDGEVVVLLDPDVVLPRFWAEGLLRALAEDPRTGAVGPRSAGAPGAQRAPGTDTTTPAAFRALADSWRREHAGRTSRAARLTGTCLALRRSALLEVGGLDERYGSGGLDDADLCVRLRRAGWTLRVADEVLVQAPVRSGSAEAARHARATWGPSLGEDVLLSAALIVKDEQQALPRCLAALRGVVDEVVVCDTGSTDRTVEVAEAFGARVVHTPWTGDFAAARNAVLQHCRGTWVLSVDADEQLHLEPGTDLRRQLLTLDADALAVPVRSRSDEAGGPDFEHAAGRLFRRGALAWVGAVHETLVDTGTGATPVYVPCGGVRLDHDGYVGRVYEERGKSTRNLLLAEKDHAQALAAGDDRRLWKTAYELARALSRDEAHDARAAALLQQALDLMPPGLAHLRSDAHVRLAGVHVRAGRTLEAEQAARTALQVAPGDPAALLVLGQVLSVVGRHAEALALLDAAPSGGDEAVRDLAKRDVALPLLRARLLHRLGRTAEAERVLVPLAQGAPGSVDWPLVHDVLTARNGSATGVAVLVAAAPEAALAALDGLPQAQLEALTVALAELGVDAAAHSPAALRAARLDEVLQGHDPAAVAEAALALEDTDVPSALALWERVAPTPPVRAARARCLLQLGRVDDAVTALDGLDPSDLAAADLLVVVAVAAAAGDRATAQALLDGVGALPDALAATLPGLVTTLGLALPDRVDREQVSR